MDKKLVPSLLGSFFVFIIIFSIAMNAKDTITIEMSENVQEFSGEKMSESLLDELEIDDPERLQLVTHWGGPMRFDLSSDGTIEHFIWEMAIKNKKGHYDIYQANKDEGQHLHVTKLNSVKEKDTRNGTILDALVTFGQLPWDSLFAVLPKGDKIGVRMNNVYDQGEEVVLRKESAIGNKFSYPVDFYFLKNQEFEKVNGETLDLNQRTYAVTVYVLYKQDDGFVGQAEAVVFIPLKHFNQMQ